MKSPLDTELAWAAGFFDGEGYCGSARRPKLVISQNEPETLYRFQAAVGIGKVTGPYDYPYKKNPFWRYSTGSIDNTNVAITKLWPYLSRPKRRQWCRVVKAREELAA